MTAARAEPDYPARARASGVATIIAAILAVVGVVSMIVGAGGAFGIFDLDAARRTSLIGLGLIALGSGALLLVILHAWRITTR
jgi:hypothetical protein